MQHINKPRVALGMSGGVDSSLSAHLLVEAGYDVTGVYLECWRAPGCRTEEDRKDALAVALQLNIPFEVLDFKQTYKDKVVEYFFDEYQKGRTPNPDVMCNKEVKFGIFYDWAMKNNFDFVATGHYATLTEHRLTSSADTHKDQTYFLYQLREEQLEHILFPIGHLPKSHVRAEAKKRQLAVAEKKDSVGICFIGDINVHTFLKERLGENPGEVIDMHGNVIGDHQGLWFYTVGQRHGFTVRPTHDHIPPFYVIKKIPKKNQLVVGFGAETYQHEFAVTDLHWIRSEETTQTANGPIYVRIRHTGQLCECAEIHEITTKNMHVILKTPIQGIAEGQSAVFYTKNAEGNFTCLGGGIIS